MTLPKYIRALEECSKSHKFSSSLTSDQTYPETVPLLSRYPPFNRKYEQHLHHRHCRQRNNTDMRLPTGSAPYQDLTITINKNVGNVTDSYKNVWNNCEISVSDEKRQILEWLSPMAPRERHQAVREGRVDGVGNWFLRTDEFEGWCTSEDQAVNPVLFCHGDPGVGKTYLRCVKVILLKWSAILT